MMILSQQINEVVTTLSELTSKIPNRVDIIQKEISLCEQEILDIQHTIEMTKVNAYQGWKNNEDLRITLVKRRELKDELETLNRLAERLENKITLDKHTSAMSQSITSRKQFMKARTYSLRVRKDLVNVKCGIVTRETVK